tara:strand:+ start:10125 stop:10922 length:798 start_codon:yes stop_codon:yes gene_type:complete
VSIVNWLPDELPLAYINRRKIYSRCIGSETGFYEINIGNQNPDHLLLWLHGSGNSYKEMIMLIGPTYVKQMIKSKNEGKSVRVIIPYCLPDLMWMNTSSPVWGIENYIVEELIPSLSKESGIKPGTRHEIHGYSMGGYAALRFGLKYSHIFEKVVAVGAGPLADQLSDNVKGDKGFKEEILRVVYGNNERLYNRSLPYSQAILYQDLIVQRGLNINIIIGEHDEAIHDNLRLSKRLKQLGIDVNLSVLEDCSHPLRDYIKKHPLC